MAQNRSGLGNLIIVLLLGVVFFQVFADDSTTTTSDSDNTFYYEFSQLDLTNVSNLEIIEGTDYESLRITDYTGLQTYVLDAPNDQVKNASKYELEIKVDLSDIYGNASAIFDVYFSQDAELLNETLRDALVYTGNEDYEFSQIYGTGDAPLASGLYNSRLDVIEDVTFIYEVDTTVAGQESLIWTVLHNGTELLSKDFSLFIDVSKNNGEDLALMPENQLVLALLEDNDGAGTLVELGSGYIDVEYVKVTVIE